MWLCGSLADVIHHRPCLATCAVFVMFAAIYGHCTVAQAQSAENTGDSVTSGQVKSNNKSNLKQKTDKSGVKKAQNGSDAKAPKAPKESMVDSELETKPYDFESLGMKMRLPKGTLVAKDAVGNAVSWMVSDERDPTRWLFRINAVSSNDPQSDTESQMKNHLQTLKEAGSKFTLLSDRPTKICGLPARFFWLSTPTGDIQAISGWFMLQTDFGRFVVFSILTTEKDFAYAESVIDHAASTIELRDMSVVQKERTERLQQGAEILKSITQAKITSVADGKKKLFRSWRETPSGDVELAWVSIAISQSPRGLADPSANEKNLSESAKEPGFLISIDSRSIGEDGLTLTSSRNRYWVANDFGSEVWSVRSVPQIPGPKNIFSQTGARLRVLGEPAGTDLAVLTSAQGAAEEPLTWTIPNSSYLAHPLSFILAQLLPRATSAPHHFALWCFDPSFGKISQRTFKWKPDAAHAGHWLLETQPSLDGPTSLDEVDAQGHLLLRSEPNGVRMAPTTLTEIERLWKAKGLQP